MLTLMWNHLDHRSYVNDGNVIFFLSISVLGCFLEGVTRSLKHNNIII